ncbi:MAG: hypothetical protein ACK4ON_00350 [Bacteroidia bacterium]
MSSINKYNCESWFLDYFEGNLSPEQSEQLFQFLDAHPEFQESFNEYENITLYPENLCFNVQTLFKDIPDEIANEISGTDYIAISYAESIFTAKEKNKIDKLIEENNVIKEAVDSYSGLKLKPDMAIVFDEKNELKKPVFIPFVSFRQAYKYLASAAAVVLFALTLWNYFPEDKNIPVSGLGVTSKRPVLVFKQKELNSEPLKNAANIKQTRKLNKNYRANKNNNVQTIKNTVNTENKEIELVEKNNYPDKKEQNSNDIDIQKEVESPIKSNQLAINSVKTLNNDKYLSPDNLIISKLLKSNSEELLARNNTQKSKFWSMLDFASKRYSDITGKKVKIKKVDNEDNTIIFALITEKFEISHIGSKK